MIRRTFGTHISRPTNALNPETNCQKYSILFIYYLHLTKTFLFTMREQYASRKNKNKKGIKILKTLKPSVIIKKSMEHELNNYGA
jgi:hypothetical protein